MAKAAIALVLVAFVVLAADARKHHLEIRGDDRKFFPVSTFGFYVGGFLAVNITNFSVDNLHEGEDLDSIVVGLSLDKTANDAQNPYVETAEGTCILAEDRELPAEDAEDAILTFKFNFGANRTSVECSDNIQSLNIFPDRDKFESYMRRTSLGAGPHSLSDSGLFQSQKAKAKAKAPKDKREANAAVFPLKDVSSTTATVPTTRKGNKCDNVRLDLLPETKKNRKSYNTSFVVYIATEEEVGLYSLYFHNCHNYWRNSHHSGLGSAATGHSTSSPIRVSFDVELEEKNHDSYLSAGEMPLPALYILMSVLFFLSGCFWVFILRKNGTEQVFRIHWVMATLVYLKSLSLFFHGVNYHKIENFGHHIEAWAILYYITHLLKGALLFFTIVLIGSGWAFIKHILSDKEKRIFMMVLPLQVIANVAYIIIEESEEGEAAHNRWKEVFILVDLVCCGAILFPVVWSIRHLQDSSRTDGKASISLEKLKLFRHFYIMVVCYIYFTRIIAYLLKIVVPFQYEWLDEMFREMATFVFFVMTGYKFRPASNNPYFSVPTDGDDDYDMGEVLIGGTAINDQVTNRKKRVLVDDDDSEDDEGMVFFPEGNNGNSNELDDHLEAAASNMRTESSHDLD